MKTFKVWCPEIEEEDEAVEVTASHARAAAEERAAATHDGEECIDFLLRDGDDLYEVTVECEMEWNFNAIIFSKTKKPEERTVAARLDIDPTRAGTSKEGE